MRSVTESADYSRRPDDGYTYAEALGVVEDCVAVWKKERNEPSVRGTVRVRKLHRAWTLEDMRGSIERSSSTSSV